MEGVQSPLEVNELPAILLSWAAAPSGALEHSVPGPWAVKPSPWLSWLHLLFDRYSLLLTDVFITKTVEILATNS